MRLGVVCKNKGTLEEVLRELVLPHRPMEELLACLDFGGVWLKPKGKSKPIATKKRGIQLMPGDMLEVYFNPKLYSQKSPVGKALWEQKDWGLWYKPAGLLSQGSPYGDKHSILRHVEEAKGKSYLIHRLDREAMGLMLFAYTSEMARVFSGLFQNGEVQKVYQVQVAGDPSKKWGHVGVIDRKLDGKEAQTIFKVVSQHPRGANLMVEIEHGRLHQIRRHLDMIGHPVLGDPKYGKNNKNKDGLRLQAYSLGWDLGNGEDRFHYSLSRDLALFPEDHPAL